MASGLSFNGSSSFASISDSDTLDLKQFITIEVIAKFANTTGGGLVCRNTNGYIFSVSGTGKLTFGGATGTTTVSTTAYKTYQARYDGANAKVFIDGVEDGTAALGTAFTALADAILIGKTYANAFAGMDLAQVRIWNYPRSNEQLALFANTKLSGQEDGLVFYSECSDGTGATLTDKSDNRNNGTITAGTWVTTAPDLALAERKNGLALATGNSIVFNYPSLTNYTLEVGVIESGVSTVYFNSAPKSSGTTQWTYSSGNFTITQTTAAVRYIRLWDTASKASGAWDNNVDYVDAGIIGLWKCNEGYGDILHDSSPNNNVGTINGAKWIEPKDTNHVYELQFNGTSDYVEVPDSSSLDITGDITYLTEAVFYDGASNNVITFIDKGYTTQWLLAYYNSAGLSLYAANSGNLSDSSGWRPINGQKYILGFKISSNTLSFYCNGRLLSTGITVSARTANTSVMRLGARTGTLQEFFKGRLGKQLLYNRALTDAEIKAITNDLPHPTNGLVLDLPMDEGYGYGVVKDRSTYGNDGSIVGAQWVLKDRGGLLFDGVNDYATLMKQDFTQFTIEVKGVFSNSVTTYRPIVHQWLSSDIKWNFYIETNHNLKCQIYTGSTFTNLDSGLVLADNTCHIGSISYDGATVRSYVDGIAGSYASSALSSTISSYPILLMKNYNSNYFTYSKLVEVRIWNYARSVAEIAAYKDIEIDANSDGLVFLWRGKVVNGIAIDESKYQNHGTVVGALPDKSSATVAKIATERRVVL